MEESHLAECIGPLHILPRCMASGGSDKLAGGVADKSSGLASHRGFLLRYRGRHLVLPVFLVHIFEV